MREKSFSTWHIFIFPLLLIRLNAILLKRALLDSVLMMGMLEFITYPRESMNLFKFYIYPESTALSILYSPSILYLIQNISMQTNMFSESLTVITVIITIPFSMQIQMFYHKYKPCKMRY